MCAQQDKIVSIKRFKTFCQKHRCVVIIARMLQSFYTNISSLSYNNIPVVKDVVERQRQFKRTYHLSFTMFLDRYRQLPEESVTEIASP